MKELNMFHNYETEKITRKARKSAIIAGGTTEQHVIIAGFLPRHWFYKQFSRAEQPNNTL